MESWRERHQASKAVGRRAGVRRLSSSRATAMPDAVRSPRATTRPHRLHRSLPWRKRARELLGRRRRCPAQSASATHRAFLLCFWYGRRSSPGKLHADVRRARHVTAALPQTADKAAGGRARIGRVQGRTFLTRSPYSSRSGISGFLPSNAKLRDAGTLFTIRKYLEAKSGKGRIGRPTADC